MSKLIPMSITLAVSLVEAVGLTVLRMKQWYSIPVSSSMYAFGVVPLLFMLLKYEGIGMSNFFWNVFSTILMFIIGVYIFHEKLYNLQIIGVIISLFGLFLILIAPDT